MAEPPVFSSQGSQYEQHQILNEQENLASSPTNALEKEEATMSTQRLKKPPTVTPKRFTKFFTPRSTLSTQRRRQSKAGRQLKDITKTGANRRRSARPTQHILLEEQENDNLSSRPLKRRKHSIDIASSPPQSSPLKQVHLSDQIKIFEDAPTSPAFSDEEDITDLLDDFQPFSRSIRRLRHAGPNQRTLQRTFGGYDALSRGRRGYDHCVEWRAETANFVSAPTDIHAFNGTALPFCTASCNTNSLIAIGEEEGGIQLIDSASSLDFSNPYVSFRPHHNAIMDVAFSSDDYMLATASGDQTSRVIDMHTQQTICILSGHKSSVKQVHFQPNDDHMITTSSRDGSVLVWDLRCGTKGSVQSLRTAFARNVDNGDVEPTVRYSKYALDVGTAHRSTKSAITRTPSSEYAESAGVSITAIQHLPTGREHLLLTTSEVNSAIKLWDLRNVARRTSAPVSSTPVPVSHDRTRNYGINAMALSGDGARLYTACRDGNVYAYSANHFILGSAPEVLYSSSKGRMSKTTKAGIGPLYGFRHPALRMGSFYIKASMRPRKGDKSEMLAVGSSDNCAVLFPTDERYLPARERHTSEDMNEDEEETELPSLPVLSSRKSKPGAAANSIPVHEHGTALIRGHKKEVTSLTWSHDGDLVTVSDDFSARCWRQDSQKARELRGCGEGGGQRWACGWAEMDATWDEDDG